MATRSSTAYKRHTRISRDYAGGRPASKFGGNLCFVRYVQTACRREYGQKRITHEELAFATGISPAAIGYIVRGERPVSLEHAWIIGQTLRTLGVWWSSGLFALALAGYDEHLLGVIGRLVSNGRPGGPMFPGCLRENWHVLAAAPFEDVLYQILSPWGFTVDCYHTYVSCHLGQA